MTPDEVIAILRLGMCSPTRLAEQPCEACAVRLRAIATVEAMAAALGLPVGGAAVVPSHGSRQPDALSQK